MKDELKGFFACGTFKQWAILSAVCFVGLFAFMMLAGDENPEQPLSLTYFIIIKVAALTVLIICYRVLRWCNRKGLLPDIKEEDEL